MLFVRVTLYITRTQILNKLSNYFPGRLTVTHRVSSCTLWLCTSVTFFLTVTLYSDVSIYVLTYCGKFRSFGNWEPQWKGWFLFKKKLWIVKKDSIIDWNLSNPWLVLMRDSVSMETASNVSPVVWIWRISVCRL